MFKRLKANRKRSLILVFLALLTFFFYISLVSKNSNELKFYYKKQALVISHSLNGLNDKNTNFCVYDISNKTNYKNVINKKLYSLEKINLNLIRRNGIHLELGGISRTSANHNCTSTKNIAIIIPYKNRLISLKLFLNNMHKYFSEQKYNYGIYLVEPVENITFNRGILMNVGFVEAVKDKLKNKLNLKWNCFVFHDVDLIPEDKRIIYTCDDAPMHYAVSVSSLNYKYNGEYLENFGGINSFTFNQFMKINGFSNKFFGWGGEDNDLYYRSLEHYDKVIKLTPDIGKYYMVKHKKDIPNPDRFKLLDSARSVFKFIKSKEGLSTLKYKLVNIERDFLFTRFYVYYNQSDILQNT